MNTPVTEIIFPPRLTPGLRDLRDSDWAQLIDRIAALDTSNSERMAFELLVVRWSGCVNCQADSFRAMQGCALCAAQAIRRYRGNTHDLTRLLSEAEREIETFIAQVA
jgi:hypothetical protein